MKRSRDTLPLQIPSRFHVFECIKEHIVCRENEKPQISSENHGSNCAIYIDWLDGAVANLYFVHAVGSVKNNK